MAPSMPSPLASEPAVVLVTGASRGLGRGIALELARAGFSVAVHFANDEGGAVARRRIEELLGAALKSSRTTHTL